MKSDNELVLEAMELLIQNLGKTDAIRFISLLLKKRFDYTSWQQDLLQVFTVQEISTLASSPETSGD